MINTTDKQALRASLETAKTVAICGHANPDGDCIWSCLWLGLFLEAQGKTVSYYTPTPLTSYFWFTAPFGTFNKEYFDPKVFDCIVCVDIANQERSSMADYTLSDFEGKLFIIDHHYSNSFSWCPVLLDDQKSSCAEIIQELLEEQWWAITNKDLATMLLLGIMSDTWNFMRWIYPEQALRAAARLLEAGANKQLLIKKLYQSNNFSWLKGIWTVIQRSQSYKDTVVWSYHTDEDLTEWWVTGDDVEPAYFTIRSVHHDWAFLLCKAVLDNDQPYLKCSFRAHANTVDVSLIAKKLWWWWHKAAAAWKVIIHGTLQETIDRVLEIAHTEILQQQS